MITIGAITDFMLEFLSEITMKFNPPSNGVVRLIPALFRWKLAVMGALSSGVILDGRPGTVPPFNEAPSHALLN